MKTITFLIQWDTSNKWLLICHHKKHYIRLPKHLPMNTQNISTNLSAHEYIISKRKYLSI